ncbi:MAG: wax ester/triacylglycerol synthase family O-acyltransferase [Blastomonas sp.]
MSDSDLDLGPGLTRLRPDDHFMILSETDASPMHVGALIFLDTGRAGRDGIADALRAHIASRLPATPLLARLVQSPEGYDSDVWADVARCDPDYHIARISDPLDADQLRAMVARLATERLNLARPPFRAFVFDRLADGGAAFYLKMHHSVADGIGFQHVLGQLSDQSPLPPQRTTDAVLPDAEHWRKASERRFDALAPRALAHAEQRRQALEALKQLPQGARPETPTLRLSGPTSAERHYQMASFDLDRFRQLGRAFGATINDMFLAVASTAIRSLLLALDDLPESPIVANSARSYRREEHGPYGNRIVALNPHLATHIADPIERLRAIRESMAAEKARSPLDEALLDQPERPFGARERRAKFAERTSGGARLLPGNVTLSNVPGPAEPLSYGGFRQLANYPVPILGSGRFLNITARRNADMLDMGMMADPLRLTNCEDMAHCFAEALNRYEELAGK